MATLATYFGLGEQTHRSLDDVRMNLEVLKYCATVLFLESSLCITAEEVEPNTAQRNPFDMGQLSNEMEESYELSSTESSEMYSVESSAVAVSDGRSDLAGFLEPNEVLIPSICASFVTFSQRIQLFHEGFILRLCCSHLEVRFGISKNFLDHAGRPRLNFVVNAPESLCKVLDACDRIARKLSSDLVSSSEWWPVVIRKDGFVNNPTVRLHIPYTISGDNPYQTEMYQKDSGGMQKLVFSKYDAAELDSLFTPGTFVDAFFSIDPYDYQQSAGIRLVAKKLIIHS
uniref:Uncharacterized protein n=2 Tax=Quercus lobata TaxID=97700 RepID=A0A7N2MPW4_QUELO